MPSTRRSIRVKVVMATGAALALVLSTSVVSAQAGSDPVYPSAAQVKEAKAAAGDKAAQIAVVEGRLKAASARLAEVQTAAEVAAEKYNLARILLQERTDAATAAGERAAAARTTAGMASDELGQLAARTYRQGVSLGQLEAFLSSKGPQEVLDRAAGIRLMSDIGSRIVRDANASSAVSGALLRQAARAKAQQLAAAQAADSARAAAAAQVASAAAETATIQKQRGAMIAQLATLRNTSVTLERQREDGLKAQARAAAAARAAAQARAAAAAARQDRQRAANQPTGSSQLAAGPVPGVPLSSRGGVSAVIAFAQAQIGDPYVWGASGPGSWDCSGLTQKAWARAGVNLAHYTGYQWAETRRVPIGQLQPGDLVFFGVSGPQSHHVGLYVGNGMMINAPYTGASVRYDSIYGSSDLLPYGGRP